MKEYLGMVGVQIVQVLQMIISKYAIQYGMSTYSFIFYSSAFSSLIGRPSSSFSYHLPQICQSSPLTFIVICGFLIFGLLGFLTQIFGYTGTVYSSATLATTMFNLIPGFTFIFAILSRMEQVDFGRSTTQAKFIGAVVSIAGAIMVTLYKGPAILPSPLKSEIPQHLLVQPSNWVLGGIFLAIACVFASMYIIAQAFVLNKYPIEMIVVLFYSFICTILSAVASLIVGDNLSSYSLLSKKRLLAVLFAGVFGTAFQVMVQAWCIRRRGPVFIAMFHPIGIVISTFIGVIFLGDGVYLGSLLGSVVVVIGFYSVMWGKAKEEKIVVVKTGGNSKLHNEEAPLLQDDVEEHITSPLP